MKVLIINSVCGIRSTGRICTDIAEKLESEGNEVKIAYGRLNVPDKYKKYAVRIGNKLSPYFSALESRFFDNDGFNCKKETRDFIKWADKYNPDMVWLHNLHDHYINVPILFRWIKSRPFMKIKWTLHDCWPFTGHCVYFSYCKCEKWKTQCSNCPQKKSTPKSILLDRSKKNYIDKMRNFTKIENMSIITPSKWLANLVKESFLSEYPITILNNTIDINVFKPTPSDFRKKYDLENKIIILGVALPWSKRKGLDVFCYLARILSDSFKIVLVGIKQSQTKKIPQNILVIKKTDSQEELAKMYTAADLFLNPSVEETFGLTTLEAISCGTKTMVLRNTACEEIAKQHNEIIVDNDKDLILKAIIDLVKIDLYARGGKL